MSLLIQSATEADANILAAMNKRLIEDEHSCNPMTVDELRQRMADWLERDWVAKFFIASGMIVGYALYQLREDDYYPDRPVVYIRQFFIERDFRNRGFGMQAFKLLVATSFPSDCTIALDVLASNPGGFRFWSRAGFQPYCTTMNLQHHSEIGKS
jgi:GNAT superfamily N-acetyltransferase